MVANTLRRMGIDTQGLERVNWLKWLLVAFSFSAALYIGLNAPRTNFMGRNGFELFLLICLLAIMVGTVLYRIELGVIAIVFSSFFVRFSIPTGSGSNVPVSLLVSAFVVSMWVLSMLLRRQVKLIPAPYVKPTLIFILISILSVPYSWLMLRPDLFGNGGTGRSGLGFTFVQLAGVALMILLPAVMLMTANVLKNEKWFKILFWMVIVVAIPELTSRLGIFTLNFGGLRLSTGASYALWVVALGVGMALYNEDMPKWVRGLLLGVAGIWLYYGAELGATWFSGWMPSALAVMFLIFLRSRKLFLVVLAIAFLMFATRAEYYIEHIWEDAIHYDSNRFEIWQVIIFDLTLTKTNFLLGAGPAGYLPFYETYYPGNAWVSHNNYVDIFAEIGLIGFSVFLWMLFTIFREGWRQRFTMPTNFLKGFNYGVLAGFVGTLFAMGLGDWFIPFVYNIGIPGFDFAVYGWLLTGAMLALSQFRVAKQNAKS